MSRPARNPPAGEEGDGRDPAASELTIYIVEDSRPVRERLIETVREIPNTRVVGQAEAVGDALEGVRSSQPRVLILDMQLRGGSGIRLLKQMRATGVVRPELVIVVTNYPTDDYRKASHDCGADHFFDKASEFDKVRDVLMQHGRAMPSLAPNPL
ncbi:DNA-binding NarL/FixJ family response regulator [Povalibacter uvarum]|uniref:DNA-binding NarL/FixJ family response regulator n=1 Tax=Povalibacter uvarum TaxID=732238 RepID=A0A841HQ86_9GAMM|nr:response regulator [Povalibacter uvarum]MBB6094489.1 DNA-binding NarL/FixJ family response regulator [Povalibacter uvarum]